jgi:hypothetical protein
LSTYFGEEHKRHQNMYNVPHLDLLKIRGSIANGNQKIKEELLKRNHLSKEERIERLEIELEYTRRELTKNIIDLREETQRRKTLERICEELEGRTEMLQLSYLRAADKLKKYQKRIKENKEKQFAELDETVQDVSATLVKHDNNLHDMQQRKMRQPEHVAPKANLYDSPEEYKIHLELLARDLAKNTKIQNMEGLKSRKAEDEEEWRPRLKRSKSNPFLYFNERREDIMEVHAFQGTGQEGRLEQTAIFGLGKGEDLDDIMI